MAKAVNVTCIMCPKGCPGTVSKHESGMLELTGFTCKRGEEYAQEEITLPKRMLTTTVKIDRGELTLLPVVSKNLLPKDKVMDCLNEIRKLTIMAPIYEGDLVVPNILGLGVDIVASRDCILA